MLQKVQFEKLKGFSVIVCSETKVLQMSRCVREQIMEDFYRSCIILTIFYLLFADSRFRCCFSSNLLQSANNSRECGDRKFGAGFNSCKSSSYSVIKAWMECCTGNFCCLFMCVLFLNIFSQGLESFRFGVGYKRS